MSSTTDLVFVIHFPDQPQLKTLKITDELTEFAIVDPATAWWDVAGEWNREEYLFNKTPLNEVSEAQTPMTLEDRQGTLYVDPRGRPGGLRGLLVAAR